MGGRWAWRKSGRAALIVLGLISLAGAGGESAAATGKRVERKECLDFEALTFEAEFPAVQGCTADNLKAAIAGEHHETECMYPEFADVAEKEGYADIASRLEQRQVKARLVNHP